MFCVFPSSRDNFHQVNQCLLSTMYVPVTLLGVGEILVYALDNPCWLSLWSTGDSLSLNNHTNRYTTVIFVECNKRHIPKVIKDYKRRGLFSTCSSSSFPKEETFTPEF